MSETSIQLRLGNQALVSDSKPSNSDYSLIEMSIGDELLIEPGKVAVVSTLEFVSMPADLLGLGVVPASITRFGLFSGDLAFVDPGFAGRLSVSLHNGSTWTQRLTCGQRFFDIRFAHVTATQSSPTRYLKTFDDELRAVKDAQDRLRPEVRTNEFEIRMLYEEVLSGPASGGASLENLVVALLSGIEGLDVIGTRARLAAEEIDVLVNNTLEVGFWRLAGSPIVIECKDWKERVGAPQIGALSERIDAIGPDAKTGILVCRKGVTGTRRSDAVAKIREKRQKGQYIVVLDDSDLERCVNGESMASAVERRYTELLLI
jgi:deoxycytidine triphosphate deaminase